ncbi:hypothetical protein EPO05_06150 [Patescibacteria group bacterium]|nr:MAG: hypothetical protein EPO05_06150 [Patescibacteria group bacterium]
MPQIVDVNPTVPPGSESLKLGPSRFQAIEQAILKIFGFDGTTEQTFGAPFNFDPLEQAAGLAQVNGPPVTPLGIATRDFVLQRSIFATITSATGALYTGNPDPPIDDYVQGVVYVLLCGGVDSINSSLMLQLGNAPLAKEVRMADGQVPVFPQGVFSTGSVSLVIYDGTFFRIVGGDMVPSPPLVEQQAAPKRYVDTVHGDQHKLTMQTDVTIPGMTVTDVMTMTVTTPAEGFTYFVFASYLVHLTLPAAVDDGFVHAFNAWITDGNIQYLGSGPVGLRNFAGIASFGGCSASGFAPTSYGANQTIPITVQVQSNADPMVAGNVQQAIINGMVPAQAGPPSNLFVMFVRIN